MLNFLNWIIATVIREENVLVLGRCMLRDLGVKGHDVGTIFQMVQNTFICTYI